MGDVDGKEAGKARICQPTAWCEGGRRGWIALPDTRRRLVCTRQVY